VNATRVARRAREALVENRRYGALADRVDPLTMVRKPRVIDLCRLADDVLENGVEGDFVECGVWRGGASFMLCDLLDRRDDPRAVWMFDSFEGMPLPQPIDGEKPAQMVKRKNATNHVEFGNCVADFDEVSQSAIDMGHSHRVKIVKGWFQDTVPEAAPTIGPIALLRLDGDWYESTKVCLDHLYDLVVPGGVVIFDDYYSYDGCAVAVHEFLGSRMSPDRLVTTSGHTYLRKL
jgi:O-methyltransferase